MRYRRLPEVANLRLELRAGRLAQEDLDVAAHQPVRETVPKLPDRGVLGALSSPHEPVPQRTRRELRPFEEGAALLRVSERAASPNAIGYDVWASTNNNAPAIIGSTATTSLSIPLPAGPVTWYVGARFNNCPTLFSPPRTLTFSGESSRARELIDAITDQGEPQGS